MQDSTTSVVSVPVSTTEASSQPSAGQAEQQQREAVDTKAADLGRRLLEAAGRAYADAEHQHAVGLLATAAKCAAYVSHIVATRQSVRSERDARNDLALEMGKASGSTVTPQQVLDLVRAHHGVKLLQLPDTLFKPAGKGRVRAGWGRLRALMPLIVDSVSEDGKSVVWSIRTTRQDGEPLGIESAKAMAQQAMTDGSSEAVIRERVAELLGKEKQTATTTERTTAPEPVQQQPGRETAPRVKQSDQQLGKDAAEFISAADDLDVAFKAFGGALDAGLAAAMARGIAAHKDARGLIEAMLPAWTPILRRIQAEKLAASIQTARGAGVNGHTTAEAA